MNKKKLLLLLPVIALASCAKTERLYTLNQYNSPKFNENYYTEWEGIDDIKGLALGCSYSSLDYSVQSESSTVKIGGVEVEGKNKWGGLKEEQFGYAHNLSSIEKGFNYGVTSKLFDGRVRCEGKYQKSRVQLDKTGFAMYFPKALKQVKYLAFACRGGSDYPSGQEFSYTDMKINVEWTFYIHVSSSEYKIYTFILKNIEVPVDNGGNTALVSFVPFMMDTFVNLQDATAMSFKWEFADFNKIKNEHFRMLDKEEVDVDEVNADALLLDDSSDVKYYVKNGDEIIHNTEPYNSNTKYYVKHIPDGEGVHDDMTDDSSQENKHHLALMLYEVFIGDSIWG